ncbi:hypothetical protein JI739_01335 [Ramlibacter sp. AW1]|uniref:Uncharacterized protein n=1 Tax=Ramlibacter aurantiacus TaxID=2801330 RepID=A0A936ZDK4_9BURK|nr:DUF5985 family protein [Ramlibacter aurantiacus]MBL0418977.1 hypothetical protein [Ramlibacter aurantiacus]
MNQMLSGAIAISSAIAGLFFFRFWHRSRDRFFLYFALSFWIEAANRAVLGLMSAASELEPFYYLVRVVAYGLILVAILQKNRPGG